LSAPAIINGKEVFDLLREDLAALEDEFGQDTVSGVQAITEIGEYLRAGGGKRIRPALLFLSSKLFHYEGRGAVRLGARRHHFAKSAPWRTTRRPCRRLLAVQESADEPW
jgi:octaprenyl-diphosphate synthase